MTKQTFDLLCQIDVEMAERLQSKSLLSNERLNEDAERRAVQLFLDGRSVESIVQHNMDKGHLNHDRNFVNCAIRKALRKAMDSANL